MKIASRVIGGVLCLLWAGQTATCAAELHIAPTGKDTNPGTIKKPFKTVERARDAVRSLKAKIGLPIGGVDIILHGGQYLLTRTITLTPQDSGAPGKLIRYRAAKGETPVLTSAKPITGWRKYTDANPSVQPSAKGNLWVADIAKGWRLHFLYVDGKPQTVACLSKSGNWHEWPIPIAVGIVGPSGQSMTLQPGHLDNVPNNGDLEMNLMPVQYWNTLSVIRDIDSSKNICKRHSLSPTTFWKDRFCDTLGGHGYYNLQNALKFLTQPGEWCVDSAQGKVYYWPIDGTMKGKKAWAPNLYRLMQFNGKNDGETLVHHIEIRGLTFTCTDRLPEDKWPEEWVKRQAELPDAMVFLEGIADCTLENNTFTYSGSYSLALQYFAQRIKVIGNEMGYSGCGGVQLQGYGPGKTDINRDNIIHRNYIHHTGSGGYRHSAAITLFQSGNNDISLNWIDNVPYAGIQIAGAGFSEFGPGKVQGAWDSYGNSEAMYRVRWSELPQGQETVFTRESFKPYLHSRNNKIRNNRLTSFMNGMCDGGGLYSWGCGLGNVWDGNLLQRDFKLPGDNGCLSIYMDDCVDGAILTNNISWNQHSAYCYNKGANTWKDNISSTEKPANFDARLIELTTQAKAEGGWPGKAHSLTEVNAK
ncbi:MAG: right-handed parallel beta-helix repeat-containing protein [Armatimonadetes bacterium]|nr:right-handed parallel beta-helix repeat-containing protein [Armatimonadota bacterium]